MKTKNHFKQDCKDFSKYIAEEDRDSIYNMFCEKSIEQAEFEEDLNAFLNLLYSYELDFQSMELFQTAGGESSSVREGIIVQYSCGSSIKELYDENCMEYEIGFSYVGVDENPVRVGVNTLALYRVIHDSELGYDRYEILLYIGDYQPNIVKEHEGQEGFYFY